MKIAYFGLPLGALLLSRDGHRLGPIVLSPAEAPGRRRLGALRPDLLDAGKLGDELEPAVEAALASEAPDLLVSWFWTRKLPHSWLSQPPLGAIGVHPSLLPKHRGPNPFFGSIDGGDEVTGVTAHRLDAEYDTGRILGQRSVQVGERDAWQLARALDRPSIALLRETAQRLARGESLTEMEQDHSLATWAPEPEGEQLKVDFGWSTERILRRVRALAPTPGLALEVLGVELFVTRAEAGGLPASYLAALIPGEAHVSDEDGLSLRTADGAVRVTRAFFPLTEEEAVGARAVAEVLSRLSPPNQDDEA